MNWRRWKCSPEYIRFKFACKQILLPLIIFQFIRTMILPATFDVILLGLLALTYLALVLDWI